jgi:hypothetical protein
MSKSTTLDRLAVKTPESAFVHVLQEEFDFSLRVSRELLNTAKEGTQRAKRRNVMYRNHDQVRPTRQLVCRGQCLRVLRQSAYRDVCRC